MARLTFRIMDIDHRPQKNRTVRLVCPKYRKVYSTVTMDLLPDSWQLKNGCFTSPPTIVVVLFA